MRDPKEPSKPPDLSDEQLMAAYVGGDDGAFRQLFARYAPLVARVVRMHVSSDEESRDLTQQAFLQLHRSRRDYHADQPLKPWLLTIAYNLVRDRWRALGRLREVPLEQAPQQVDGTAPADIALENSHRAQRLRSALATLPADQRQVVELHWFAGLPLIDVAATLGVSLSAAKVRAHRGYGRLRQTLRSSGEM
ncbi:MAG: sigma-70 family RNA polymerase sigma factor [Polyangia bacterium]